MGVYKIVETKSATIPYTSELVRRPPRAEGDRQPNYLELFDHTCLWADAFYVSGRGVCLLSPPMLNLESIWKSSKFVVDGVPSKMLSFPQLNRMALTWLDSDGLAADRVSVSNDHLSVSSGVGADMAEVFRDCNVIVTQSRDNPLDNIVDWVRFNVAINKANAVLLYDNKSKQYSLDDLLLRISSVPGLVAVVIVNWPHKFGPTGGPRQVWDSDYGQYMVWEHARWRFLRYSRAAQMGDVDELVLAEDLTSAFDVAVGLPEKILYYRARNVVPVANRGPSDATFRRHQDATLHDDSGTILKYTYVPSALGDHQQVKVHEVTFAHHPASQLVVARHCQNVHLKWRSGAFNYTYPYRDRREGDLDDPAFDKACAIAFGHVTDEVVGVTPGVDLADVTEKGNAVSPAESYLI